MSPTRLRLVLYVVLCSCVLLLSTELCAQVTPLGDSYANTASSTTNYGSAATINVDGATEISYIQFDLSGVPSGAAVSQAMLKLYVNSVVTAGSFNVDYVNGTWQEGTLDASNAPALGNTIASSVALVAASKNQYIQINVTEAVQAWLNGSQVNDGLALVANGTFDATFDSKESSTTSHSPELDIVYAEGITAVTTASGSGLTGGGTSGTLTLGLTTACSSNQVLQWNGSGWACASTATGTITGVTAGTGLSGGGTSGAVTLANTGLLNVTAGSGIKSSGGQSPTIINSGVLSITPGSGITSTGGQTPTINNSGVLAITAGTGISSTGGQSPTLSVNTSVVPELSAANTFTANLATKGELSAGGAASGQIGNGTVEVDAGATNTGTYSPGLNFGGGGEAIASDRTGTVNKIGLDFYTDGKNRMSLTHAGNLGIGTTAPTHLLEVDGTTSTTTAQMAMVTPGTDAAISVKNTGSGGHEYWIDSGSGAAGVGSGNFGIYDATALITRFVIGPTGNVGIGTTSPGAPLEVVSGSPVGIYASDSATTTAAIYGGATATSGAAWGVEGVTASGAANAYGVYGVATNTNGSAIGVYGQTDAGFAPGVYGQWGPAQSGTGANYHGNAAGVWGDAGTAQMTATAVVGTADDARAGYFENNSSATYTVQIRADNPSGPMLFAENTSNNDDSCIIDEYANFSCSGTVGGVVPVDGGSRQLAVSGIASPKNWFEDFGSGQLVNGVAVIALESDFVQTVNTEMDYKVFPVPNGDCKGLYVTHKTSTSFEVRELGGGKSNVAFDYRITALRKNYENVRFADQTAEMQKHREVAERMHPRKP